MHKFVWHLFSIYNKWLHVTCKQRQIYILIADKMYSALFMSQKWHNRGGHIYSLFSTGTY